MSVNKAILIGNLGKDPDLRYTPGGRAVATFPLATTERWTGQDGQRNESTTWHNIVVWGKPAEIMKEYLSKGRQVYIEGRISNRSYEDKDGNKRWISEVIVQNFTFIGSRGEAQGDSGGYSQDAPPDFQPSEGNAGGTSEDDDLPF